MTEKIAPAEYGFYKLTDGKVYHYSQSGKKFLPYSLTGVKDIAAGLHNCGAVTEDGKAYLLYRPGFDDQYVYKQVPGIVGAQSVTAQFGKYVFVTTSGVFITEDSLSIVSFIQTVGRTIQAVAAGKLLLLNDAGEVYEIAWQPNPTQGGLMTAGQIAQLLPVKVPFLNPMKQISGSRNNFNVALDGTGKPYGWGANWGFIFDAEIKTSASLSLYWGLNVAIKQIVLGDNTGHFIDANGNLYGFGHNGQGEVGNGYENPNTVATKAWDGDISKDRVTKPVQIAPGRKFIQICKGNSMSYFTYAQEDNGTWNAWGRGKAGVLGTGIFTSIFDEKQGNIADITRPWRVSFPPQGVDIVDPTFFDLKYPPAEAPVVVAPVVDPLPAPTPVKTVLKTGYWVIDGKRKYYIVYTDFTWKYK